MGSLWEDAGKQGFIRSYTYLAAACMGLTRGRTTDRTPIWPRLVNSGQETRS